MYGKFFIIESFILFIGWILSLSGYGRWICSYLHWDNGFKAYRNFFEVLFGFCFLFILGCLVNIILPISLAISITILLLGVFLFTYYSPVDKKSIRILSGFFLISGLTFFELLLFRHVLGDTGFYHLQSVKWIIENHTPLGLANLQYQLGFNSSWFVIAAYIDQWTFISSKLLFLTNAVLLFSFYTIIYNIILNHYRVVCLSKIPFTNKIKEMVSLLEPSEIFILLAALIPLLKISRFHLSSLSYDFPTFILTIIILSMVIKIITSDELITEIHNIFIIFFIALFAFTIKLSAIILLLLALSLILLHIIKTRKLVLNQSSSYIWSQLCIITQIFFQLEILLIIILIPYSIRGILISGNPLYPIYFFHFFNFPWSLPIENERLTASVVTAFARMPVDNQTFMLNSLQSWDWVIPWISRFISTELIMIIMTILSIIFCIGVVRIILQDKIPYKFNLFPWFLFSWIGTGLVFWFLAGPDPRFGFGFLYSVSLFLFCYPFILVKRPYPKQIISLLTILLCFFIICCGGYILSSVYDKNYPTLWDMPSPSDIKIEMNDGNVIHTPFGTPYLNKSLTWNLPLPATTSIQPLLKIDYDYMNHQYIMFSNMSLQIG